MVKESVLIISTPNINSFGAKKKGRKDEFKGLPYERRYAESYIWRDESHISLKSREEWKRLLINSGFEIITEGTDVLWDLPYFSKVPLFIEKIISIPLNAIITIIFGFLNWKWGENYICIAKKE